MKNSLTPTKLSRGAFLCKLAFAAPFLPAALATAQPEPLAPPSPAIDLGNLRAFVELARCDIRTEKALIVAENIPFTADEAIDFWPLHREYEAALNKLLDARYKLILDFARSYENMTDAQATTLTRRVFDLEGKRGALKRKYFKKFIKVIPAVKAARFFQLENQLNMALDLQLAASLPLIK